VTGLSPTLRITDPAALKAVAHPLRGRLLGLLRLEGPATASGLARRVGESSGSTSYHLRQLARFGFVEETADQPSGRERRWQATAPMSEYRAGDLSGTPDGRAALEGMQRAQLGWLARGLESWLAASATGSGAWQDVAGLSDWVLRLRPADAAALVEALVRVVAETAQRPADDDEAELVAVHLALLPLRGLP
jgi:DNA-binding transcriptional ArsR family regulator